MKLPVKQILTKGGAALAVTAIVVAGGSGAASACSEHYDDASQAYVSQSNQAYDKYAAQADYANYVHGSMSDHDDEQSDYRMRLDAALREHAPVTVDELRGTLLNTPDLAAIREAVEVNNVTIINLVEEGYPGTQEQFAGLWRGHIGYYHDYLNAGIAGDEAGKQTAKQNLLKGAGEMSQLLASASDNLNAEELNQQLAVHGDQVTVLLDNILAGNYSAAWQLNHEAYEHMGMVAEVIADGSTDQDSNDEYSNL